MQRDKDRAENIVEFLNYPYRIYPIGRLDKDSEGLLLMTNQGDLVNKIMRAGNFHEKEYYIISGLWNGCDGKPHFLQ